MADKLLLPRPSTPMIDVKTGIVTTEWRRWFESGGAILSGDAQLPVSSIPSSSQSTTGAGILYSGADGETIKFGGTFGKAPERIEVDISDLPSLASGKSYDCRAVNITPTGFDLYAKIVTSDNFSQQATSATNIGTEVPKYRFKKPITDDAYNNIYEFYFTPKLYPAIGQAQYDTSRNRFVYNDADVYITTYIGQYDFYVFSGGAWVKVQTIDLMTEYDGQINLNDKPPYITMPNHKVAIETALPIGLNGGGFEFGIEPLGSSGILQINEVQYETRSISGTESLGNKKLKCYVYA